MTAPARIAALYDIHGNLPALRAVLAEVRAAGAGLVVIGGDVLPGPFPGETLELLRTLELPLRCLRGNGERAVLEVLAGREPADVPPPYRPPLRWVAEQLDAAQREWIASWPQLLREPVAGLGEVLFCHATPRDDNEIFTRDTAEAVLRPVFAPVPEALVVCGHTHMQFDRRIGRTRVVNAGSVGMPFGEAGAYWLLLGDEVELRRTTYDLAAAAREVRASGFPGAQQFAEGNLLRPPGEAEMLAAFARVAVC